ncbi:unnamed protein product, partial [Symbiodinium pilosum]
MPRSVRLRLCNRGWSPWPRSPPQCTLKGRGRRFVCWLWSNHGQSRRGDRVVVRQSGGKIVKTVTCCLISVAQVQPLSLGAESIQLELDGKDVEVPAAQIELARWLAGPEATPQLAELARKLLQDGSLLQKLRFLPAQAWLLAATSESNVAQLSPDLVAPSSAALLCIDFK